MIQNLLLTKLYREGSKKEEEEFEEGRDVLEDARDALEEAQEACPFGRKQEEGISPTQAAEKPKFDPSRPAPDGLPDVI